jgi:hypothetical protein
MTVSIVYVVFPEPGESIQTVQWFQRSDILGEQLVATYTHGHFIVTLEDFKGNFAAFRQIRLLSPYLVKLARYRYSL